jgi:hypothetical protein
MRGVQSDNHNCFLTVLDNVLTVGDMAGGQQCAGAPPSHPGDPPDGGGGV